MLERWKSFFYKDKKKEIKHVIVCIHGFGIRTEHQFDNFKLWNKDELNIQTFPIFAMDNEKDCNPDVWIKRCESVVENYINAGYKVDVAGFSMGGVLASHVASKYPIDRLFLIAPAFEYMTRSNVISKTKEILTKKVEVKKTILPSSFTPCFVEVVKRCKDSIKNVTCPICIVHGNCDEVIPIKSSINLIEQISHNRKRLFIINNGDHHLMTNKDTGFETYQIFKLFMNRTILSDEIVNFSKDIYE